MSSIEQINEVSDLVFQVGHVSYNFEGSGFRHLEDIIQRAFKDGDSVIFFVTENQNQKLKSHFEKNKLGKNMKIHEKEKDIIHYSFFINGVNIFCSIDYDFFFNGVKFNCSIQNDLENSLMIHNSLDPQKSVLIKEK